MLDAVSPQWRPGILVGAGLLALWVLTHPTIVVRVPLRLASVVAAVALGTGRAVTLPEYHSTRRRRAAGASPRPLLVRLSRAGDLLIVPCEHLLARPRPKRLRARGLVLLAIVLVAGPVAHASAKRFPGGSFARGYSRAFVQWSKVESNLHLAPQRNTTLGVQTTNTTAAQLALQWLVAGEPVVRFGAPGDRPLPVVRSGRSTPAVVQPGGQWVVSDGTARGGPSVQPSDTPVAAPFDSSSDWTMAALRTDGTWALAGRVATTPAGRAGDVPVPADFTGDGIAELALFRPQTGEWYWAGNPTPVVFGSAGDVPVPGAYLHKGIETPAVFRSASHNWYVYGLPEPVEYGAVGDIPTPGDYDGDGLTDLSVFRPTTGEWWVRGADAPAAVFQGSGLTPVLMLRGGRRVAAVVRTGP